MPIGLIEVRRKFVNEVSRQALRRIESIEEMNISDVTSPLRLPVQTDIALEPVYEWKMGVAGTTVTTTTVVETPTLPPT